MSGKDASISQADKFKDAARELGCDDDLERFRERVAKLVKHKPVASEDAPLTGSLGKAELRILRERAQAERVAKHKPVEKPE